MAKRLIIYGRDEQLETIRAVWGGQGLRMELESIGEFAQPDEEVEKNLEALLKVVAEDDKLPKDSELNKVESVETSKGDESNGEATGSAEVILPEGEDGTFGDEGEDESEENETTGRETQAAPKKKGRTKGKGKR